jgi:hypothetical protein
MKRSEIDLDVSFMALFEELQSLFGVRRKLLFHRTRGLPPNIARPIAPTAHAN